MHSSSPLRRARRAALRLCAALALTVAAAPKAHAFSYWEHCHATNLAFRIALERVRADRGARAQALVKWLERYGTSPCGEKLRAPTSYGDMVAGVDYAVLPSDFFAADTIGPLAPGGVDAANRIPWRGIRLLMNSAQGFRAAHENAEHFGRRALSGFGAWHPYALVLASRGRVSEALVYAAFADHFLEDVFAPGHIRTPRDGMDDGLALSMHDHYNRVGARFRLQNADSLADLAPAWAPGRDLRWDSVAGRACGAVPVRDCLRAMQTRDLLFLGDDHLEPDDALVRRGRDANPEQELVLALTIARSVADVLEAYVAQDPADHVGTLAWTPYTSLGMEHRGPVPLKVRWLSSSDSTRYGRMLPDSGANFLPFDRSPIVRGGFQATHWGTRYVGGLEALVLSGAADWMEFGSDRGRGRRFRNLALFASADVVAGDGRWAVGPSVRLARQVPKLNAHLDALGGVRRFSTGRWAGHGGVGMGLGFGFAFTDLRVEYDHVLDRGGALHTVANPSMNLSFQIPLRRHRGHFWPALPI